MKMYDPPSGWMYGFPKPYNPWPGECIEDTLFRDGYPQKEINQFKNVPVRFWETNEKD